MDFEGRRLDRHRGLQKDHFSEALERASVASDAERVSVNPPKMDLWPRNPDSSDDGDPRSAQEKPVEVGVWDSPPATREEEAQYYGVHLHTESNPLGLHSHLKSGGEIGGGHSHGPQNRFGVHHHRSEIKDMVQLDGPHTHEGCSFPDGGHAHMPSNFG
jgi:hypothetical protein